MRRTDGHGSRKRPTRNQCRRFQRAGRHDYGSRPDVQRTISLHRLEQVPLAGLRRFAPGEPDHGIEIQTHSRRRGTVTQRPPVTMLAIGQLAAPVAWAATLVVLPTGVGAFVQYLHGMPSPTQGDAGIQSRRPGPHDCRVTGQLQALASQGRRAL